MLNKSKGFIVACAIAAVVSGLFFTMQSPSQKGGAQILSENKTTTPTVTVEAIPEQETNVVYDENFEDFNHYENIEGYDEDLEEDEEHGDHSAQAENIIDRAIASTGEEAKLVKKLDKISDDKWGTLDIELLDAGHPSYAPLQLKIFVTCKDQVKMIKQRPPPKREPLLKSLRICEYRGHEFDKNAHTLTIKYLLQSPDASPNEPVCNEIWEQDFSIEEACSKWKIAN